mmetsp:Transcript_12637/g.25775  ORF Transcript_12637/g.25775 Transcript_12637/m.25775 type:complete len:164 (+) Transcript_12637:3-494(+)
MEKRFRTQSSFDLRFQQEIKYILYGNVGEFDKFKDEDKKVIEEHTKKFYESEVIIKGLPFHSMCPKINRSHHHHGIKSHNEEIEQRNIDKILLQRWTAVHIEAIKLTIFVVIEATDAIMYVLIKALGFVFGNISRKMTRWSEAHRPSIVVQAESIISSDRKEK